MKITNEEIEHVSSLARLNLSSKEVEQFTRQVGDILYYMETLNKVDTKNVTPTSHVIDLYNAFRDDNINKSISVDSAIKNAPESDDSCFIVPKIVG